MFTINNESQHLLIQNVPSVGLLEEVRRLVSKFGALEFVRLAADYPATTEFTQVYYAKFKFLRDARYSFIIMMKIGTKSVGLNKSQKYIAFS